MIYSIPYDTGYAEPAKSIDPLVFSAYLKKNGWKKFDIRRTDILIFQQGDERGIFQITLPLSLELGDFAEAMSYACVVLSGYEKRSPESVINELLSYNTGLNGADPEKTDHIIGKIKGIDINCRAEIVYFDRLGNERIKILDLEPAIYISALDARRSGRKVEIDRGTFRVIGV